MLGPSASEDAGAPPQGEWVGGRVMMDTVVACVGLHNSAPPPLMNLSVVTSRPRPLTTMPAAGMSTVALGDVTGGTGKAGVPGVTGKRLLAVSTAEARCKDIHAARRLMEAGVFLEDGAVSSSGDVLGVEGRIAQPDLSTIEGEGTTELMDADVASGQVEALGSRWQIDDEATDTVSGGPRVAVCWTSAGAETAMRTGRMPIVQELSAASVKRIHLGLEDKGNDRPSG